MAYADQQFSQSASTNNSKVDQYANDIINGKLNLESVPQNLRPQVSRKVDEMNSNKYSSEFEARVDYNSEIQALASAKSSGQLQGAPSDIIRDLVNRYGKFISSQEIQGTIYSLFGANANTDISFFFNK